MDICVSDIFFCFLENIGYENICSVEHDEAFPCFFAPGACFLSPITFLSFSVYRLLTSSPLHISFGSVHSAAEALNVNTYSNTTKRRKIFIKFIHNFIERESANRFFRMFVCFFPRKKKQNMRNEMHGNGIQSL